VRGRKSSYLIPAVTRGPIHEEPLSEIAKKEKNSASCPVKHHIKEEERSAEVQGEGKEGG